MWYVFLSIFHIIYVQTWKLAKWRKTQYVWCIYIKFYWLYYTYSTKIFNLKKKTKKNTKKPQNSSLPKFILSCNKNASWIIKNVSTTSTTILSHAPNWYNVFRNIHSYSITKHALGTIERTKSAMLGYLAFLRSYRHRVLIWVLKHLPLTTTRDPSYQKRDSLGNWSTPISLVLFPSIVSYKLF